MRQTDKEKELLRKHFMITITNLMLKNPHPADQRKMVKAADSYTHKPEDDHNWKVEEGFEQIAEAAVVWGWAQLRWGQGSAQTWRIGPGQECF